MAATSSHLSSLPLLPSIRLKIFPPDPSPWYLPLVMIERFYIADSAVSSFHRFVARSPFLFLPFRFRCARGSDKFVLDRDRRRNFRTKRKGKKTKKRSEKWCANRAKGDDKGIPDDRRVIIVDGLGWAGSLDVWYFR